MRITIELRRPARRSVALVVGALLLLTPAVVLAGHHFPDVSSTHPYHAQISRITDAGIAIPFGDGTYRPEDPVRRGEMAAFMVRGLGRTGLAIGSPPMTPSLGVGAGLFQTERVAVRQLTITVPGANNAFSPQQLVHLQGRVHIYTVMNAAKGCPCEFSARIRDMTTDAVSIDQFQTFESASSSFFYRSFDIEALFAAPPGPRTYRLEVRLSWRDNPANAATFALSDRSSLSAMTFPFGPTGTSAVSGTKNVSPGDELPERRRDE